MRALRTLASDGRSGAVGIVVTDAWTWEGAVGWAEFKTRRAHPDDRFDIASTTKTFVATVVLQLVGEKRLALQDPVQRWLPGLLPRRPQITIRQLLNHTSGLLTDFGFGDVPRHRAEVISRQGLFFKPGTSVNYSNADFVFLGLVVEKVTGRSLDRVVTDRIFRPCTSRARATFISTVSDLATFFRALRGGKLLPRQQLAEKKRTIATTDAGFRFGLGIFRSLYSCGVAWGHGGLATYAVNVAVARDGSKAVITALNNPALGGDDGGGERLYCS